MSRQDGSDWHGARVSRKYKDNYDSIFKKEKKEELKPTIEGTNQRYRLVNNTCPVCKGFMVYTGVGARTCERCGHKR